MPVHLNFPFSPRPSHLSSVPISAWSFQERSPSRSFGTLTPVHYVQQPKSTVAGDALRTMTHSGIVCVSSISTRNAHDAAGDFLSCHRPENDPDRKRRPARVTSEGGPGRRSTVSDWWSRDTGDETQPSILPSQDSTRPRSVVCSCPNLTTC